MLTDGTAAPTPTGDEEIDSVTPRAAPAAIVEASTAGPNPLGLRAVRLFGEAGPCGPIGSATTSGEAGAAAAAAALDFKLAAAVLRSGGGGGSGSDEDEVSEVREAFAPARLSAEDGRLLERSSLPRWVPAPPVKLRDPFCRPFWSHKGGWRPSQTPQHPNRAPVASLILLGGGPRPVLLS